jgi:MSHA biogenesis protein MshN
MGLAAMRSNDLYTAERMFREALAVDSGDSAIWSYLYGALVRASKPAAAEKALQQGLVLAKEPVALAKLYARMLLDRGDKDAAVAVLKNYRPTPASDTDYDAFLGALLQQRGQYAEAGSIYENLLTAEPNSGSAWIGLAMSHDSLGDRADAMSAFESALRTGSLKTPLARYARRRTAELTAND